MKAFVLDRYGTADRVRAGDMPDPHPREDDVLVQVHAAGAGDLTHLDENVTGADAGARSGAVGIDGVHDQAAQGHPGVEGKKSCSVNAGPGDPGVHGHDGLKGKDGGTPGDGNQIKIDLDVMEGHYVLTVKGGKAGGGGPGGVGGTGQAGGDGPNGGNAGDIYITFASGNPTFAATIEAGGAGSGGDPGPGGAGGAGNPPGGSLGGGSYGKKGSPGTGGQFFLNGKKQKSSS